MSETSQCTRSTPIKDPSSADRLIPLIYNELRRLAATKLDREINADSLQPTALVHEAFLRLIDVDDRQRWNSRGHFYAAAAEAMRRILVERARQRNSLKRGAGIRRVPGLGCLDLSVGEAREVLAINDALDALAEYDRRTADLVKLRFFSGLTNDEAARLLDISSRQAHYLWAFARSWLRREMCEE